MKTAVGQLHFRLDADSPCGVPARDTLGDVGEQRALARAGLTAKYDDSAPTGERVGQHPVKYFALRTTPEQRHRLPPCRPAYTAGKSQRRSATPEDAALHRTTQQG
jgi:hypothetical protein